MSDRPPLLIIAPHLQDLGGFTARRSLPNDQQPMVGPFIFFDHLGPAVFPPGQGVDVRPHPHINLATVTYLFEGSLLHRDSLGTQQVITPGAVNWMTAGRGIVHSERSPDRSQAATLHAIQTWVALPAEAEEIAPSFVHYPAASLPTWTEAGATITLIAGQTKGHTSPVQTLSPIFYLDIVCTAGATVNLVADYSERAVYTVTPGLTIDGQPIAPHQLVILPAGECSITATTAARCVVVGGEPVGPRLKWWNFVSSRPERIAQAKQDWQAGRFDPVPDETEFIPLPTDI
jgi:redox-sensitive bicupin YhaK (pirin superfamily)